MAHWTAIVADISTMPKTFDLPLPDTDALSHSQGLLGLIQHEIDAGGGMIPFDRYMELALYAPGLGYYSAGNQKFGAGGDFVTAPELSALFSRALAHQCAEILSQIPGGEILEFGAGSAAMAVDLLGELERLQSLPQRYGILEISAELRARQQRHLQDALPHLFERVYWLDHLPTAFRGVVLANEILDAMPVQRFCWQQGLLRELYVGRDSDGLRLIAEQPSPLLAARVGDLAGRYAWEGEYCSELNLRAEPWIASLGSMLQEGVALLIDYGFPRHEYYHRQRDRGTLMCHYRHRAHDDALLWPGLQDMTAHVDFTAVAEAAVQAGLAVRGYTSQANFLLGNGLLEMLAQSGAGDTRAQLALSNQVKRLTMPGEMGEMFKVMALGKAWQGPLRGFALRDERARL